MLGRYDRVIVHATLDEPTVTAELLPIIQAAVEDHGGYELIVS
jgi:Ethanolamine utilization protein EutJ (predicted chaperonin)